MTLKNSSTCRRMACVWPSSSVAAVSTKVEVLPVSLAAWLTPAMLAETSWVPWAASWMLRVISPIADCCSPTDEEIAPAMALIVSMVRRSG